MTAEGLDLGGLLVFEDNSKCIDCGIGKSQYVLIEFGGFICKSCFLVHSELGITDKIQHMNDPISDLDLKKMINGGNSALFEYWEVYDLNYKAISYKYLTLSTVYYKEMLESVIEHGDYYRDLLSQEKAKQPLHQFCENLKPEPEDFIKKAPKAKKLGEKIEETWDKFSSALSKLIKSLKIKLKIHP